MFKVCDLEARCDVDRDCALLWVLFAVIVALIATLIYLNAIFMV